MLIRLLLVFIIAVSFAVIPIVCIAICIWWVMFYSSVCIAHYVRYGALAVLLFVVLSGCDDKTVQTLTPQQDSLRWLGDRLLTMKGRLAPDSEDIYMRKYDRLYYIIYPHDSNDFKYGSAFQLKAWHVGGDWYNCNPGFNQDTFASYARFVDSFTEAKHKRIISKDSLISFEEFRWRDSIYWKLKYFSNWYKNHKQ